MKRLLLVLALLLYPAVASAQVVVHFGWAVPPPVVEVSPGIQVVENGNDEVFFTNGHYWVERGGRWYWSRDYHENWVFARNGRVPLFLRNHRRGQYAHWRGADHPRRAEVRHEERRHGPRDEHHEGKRGDHQRKGERGRDRHDDHR